MTPFAFGRMPSRRWRSSRKRTTCLAPSTPAWGRYDEAAVQLTLAVDQAPDMLAARVQLALLWLTLQAPSQCELIARPLLELPEDSAYRHFGAGLSALCRGDDAAA